MLYYERIRNIREDNDMKQEDIAIILKTNQRRISRIETGNSEIRIEELKVFCEYFKISSDYILGINFQ